MSNRPLSYGRIFWFWAPLAGTWLMMSVEGPFLAAVIARLTAPTENLAAYGIAFAVALIVEAPVIMLLSASTALVKDRASYLALRRFTYTLNAVITAAMIVLLLPPVFDLLSRRLLNLPDEVAGLTYGALALLLPWPGAIGYRRFLQGTLVSHDMTNRVAYGTVVRVAAMAVAAVVAASLLSLRGAHVGALALSAGVVAEALASRAMARGIVKELLGGRREQPASPLAQVEIASFYFPLATMSILAMAIHPMVTFFMGRSRMALESLAVLPVVHGLVFVFRSLGLSYQEVAIALMGGRGEHFEKLRNFAAGLAVAATTGLALIAITPLAGVWFRSVSGLRPELANIALLPTQIAIVLPMLTVLMSFQRALLVNARTTRPLTAATVVEATGIGLILTIAIFGLDIVGVVAATSALVLGRIAGNAYLMPHGIRSVQLLRRPGREADADEARAAAAVAAPEEGAASAVASPRAAQQAAADSRSEV